MKPVLLSGISAFSELRELVALIKQEKKVSMYKAELEFHLEEMERQVETLVESQRLKKEAGLCPTPRATPQPPAVIFATKGSFFQAPCTKKILVG